MRVWCLVFGVWRLWFIVLHFTLNILHFTFIYAGSKSSQSNAFLNNIFSLTSFFIFIFSRS